MFEKMPKSSADSICATKMLKSFMGSHTKNCWSLLVKLERSTKLGEWFGFGVIYLKSILGRVHIRASITKAK